MQKQHAEGKRSERFHIECPGGADKQTEIMSKLKQVKEVLSEAHLNNTEALNVVLSEWLQLRQQSTSQSTSNSEAPTPPGSYFPTPRDQVDQQMYVTTTAAVSNLCLQVEAHRHTCA